MDSFQALRPGRFLQWNAVVWRFGGRWERLVFLCYVLTVAFLFSVLVWFVTLWNTPFPFEFYVTIGIALTNFITLRVAFDMALYTRDSWRELVHLGHFHPHEEKASDYLRYLETRGIDGRFPGANPMGARLRAVYYALIATSTAFVFGLFPLLGPLTPAVFLAIDVPVVLACARTYRSRMLEALELLDLRKAGSSPR